MQRHQKNEEWETKFEMSRHVRDVIDPHKCRVMRCARQTNQVIAFERDVKNVNQIHRLNVETAKSGTPNEG